jgi:CTP synthase (UTP-ammonia lyase)
VVDLQANDYQINANIADTINSNTLVSVGFNKNSRYSRIVEQLIEQQYFFSHNVIFGPNLNLIGNGFLASLQYIKQGF